MLTAAGFFSTRQANEAHLLWRWQVTAIWFGSKNETTGYFRLRRRSLRRRPQWSALGGHWPGR